MLLTAESYTPGAFYQQYTALEAGERNLHIMRRLTHHIADQMQIHFSGEMEAIPFAPSQGYGFAGSVRHQLRLHVLSPEDYQSRVKPMTLAQMRNALEFEGEFVVWPKRSFDMFVDQRARALLAEAARAK